MKGSTIAAEIVEEMKRKEAYRKKAKEKQCKLSNKRQCIECEYRDTCKVK